MTDFNKIVDINLAKEMMDKYKTRPCIHNFDYVREMR